MERGMKRSSDGEEIENTCENAAEGEVGLFFSSLEEEKILSPPPAPRKPPRPTFVETHAWVPDWKGSKVNTESFLSWCRTRYGLEVTVELWESRSAIIIFQSVEDKGSFMRHDYEVSRNFGEIQILSRF